MKRIDLSGPMESFWIESYEFQMYETLNGIVDKLEELENKIENMRNLTSSDNNERVTFII